MIEDQRIGHRDKDQYKPAQQTVSGKKPPVAPDRIHLGGGYFCILDRPHHPDTYDLVKALRAIVQADTQAVKYQRKKQDDDKADISENL